MHRALSDQSGYFQARLPQLKRLADYLGVLIHQPEDPPLGADLIRHGKKEVAQSVTAYPFSEDSSLAQGSYRRRGLDAQGVFQGVDARNLMGYGAQAAYARDQLRNVFHSPPFEKALKPPELVNHEASGPDPAVFRFDVNVRVPLYASGLLQQYGLAHLNLDASWTKFCAKLRALTPVRRKSFTRGLRLFPSSFHRLDSEFSISSSK